MSAISFPSHITFLSAIEAYRDFEEDFAVALSVTNDMRSYILALLVLLFAAKIHAAFPICLVQVRLDRRLLPSRHPFKSDS
jgi:hypothetical protein